MDEVTFSREDLTEELPMMLSADCAKLLSREVEELLPLKMMLFLVSMDVSAVSFPSFVNVDDDDKEGVIKVILSAVCANSSKKDGFALFTALRNFRKKIDTPPKAMNSSIHEMLWRISEKIVSRQGKRRKEWKEGEKTKKRKRTERRKEV